MGCAGVGNGKCKMKRPNIALAQPVFLGNEKKYVNECLDTGWISSVGQFVTRFEEAWAEYLDTPHVAACANGTVALHAALLAAGIGPGDEVLVPTLTYVASANAVTYCGAKPVFVDADEATMNLDPADMERRITARTKAVMPVHLYGQPCEMDAITAVARRHGLVVVEDAAEAHGALYHGRRAGTLGDIATFSFFGNKTITTGEGGMVASRNAEWMNRVRLLRGQGMDPQRRYWFPIVGYNYRMTNIQAAIGLAQTERLDEHLRRRRQVAEWYDRYLAEVDGVRLPKEAEGTRSSHWLYVVRVTGADAARRDAVMAKLADEGVETRPVFYPMHVLPPYFEPDGDYPVADRLAAEGICLPTHAALTEEDVRRVAESLREAVA
jgi:perosamine synthetase